MPFEYAFVLPILVSVWFPITFVITYTLSVLREDVPAIFPYISDTGNWSPESCIFGIMLNLGAILMAVVMYIRYMQIREICQKNTKFSNLVTWNKVGWVLALVACLGVCIVGNFQETKAFEVHILGAFLAFGLGSVYQSVQTFISMRIHPQFGDKTINIARICCSVISSTSFIGTSLFAGLALMKFKGSDITKWGKEDGAFEFHLVSTTFEWVLALTTIVFLSLFTKEFRQITISPPMIDINA